MSFPENRVDHEGRASEALQAVHRRIWSRLRPPPFLSVADWPVKYRFLSNEESAMRGRFSWDVSPALRGIAEVISLPSTRKVVVQKSAQIGYTAGIVCNVIGYHIHYRPSVIIAAFPRTQAAKDFAAEKLDPMIRACKVLRKRVNLKSRADGNSTQRKRFPGGLMKLVGTNSPSDVKSTSARLVVVEEPDDAAKDVRGQGNSLKLLEERVKTYGDHLILIGGTPTAKDASEVEAEMRKTDKRYFHVPCHSCSETHVLDWDNVTIPEDVDQPPREVYGYARHEKAYYTCPHCATVWTDDERITNLRRAERDGGGWVPTAVSTIPGFYMNELLSTFDESRIPILARKYLEAKDKMDKGDATSMVAFYNSTLGKTWEYTGELPEEDTLRERAEEYAEWSCPVGALYAVMTVDVQHDRLAVTVWVFGREEEMWLAFWGELYGPTIVAHAGAWVELEQYMAKTVRHSTGAKLPVQAVGIDCSDGQTSEAVYAFVRKHNSADRQVKALKGAADSVGRVEIWTPPKRVDPNARSTKAARAGVQVNIVGTAKAKDLILGFSEKAGRVRLEGSGAGRMHWYKGVRDDFYEQLLSEIKIPRRDNPNKREWKPRTDRRNEGLDCTVYSVYLYRALRLNLQKASFWDALERRMRQGSLIDLDSDSNSSSPAAISAALAADSVTVGSDADIAVVPLLQPPKKTPRRQPQPSAFASEEWGSRL